jgi:putative oxidoreductase
VSAPSRSTVSATTTTSSQDWSLLVGRILIASLFVPAGFNKLMGFAGTTGYIASVGLPLPALGAVIAILVELGLGLALLFGFKTRWTAVILAVFTVVTAVVFHNYWALPEAQKAMMQINFFKNMAIAGGLLAFHAFGPGRLSIDKR